MHNNGAVDGHPLFDVLETGLLIRIPRSQLRTEFSLDVLDCDNLARVIGGRRGAS